MTITGSTLLLYRVIEIRDYLRWRRGPLGVGYTVIFGSPFAAVSCITLYAGDIQEVTDRWQECVLVKFRPIQSQGKQA